MSKQYPPSVDALARELAPDSSLPYPLLVDAVRDAIAAGGTDADSVRPLIARAETALLQPAINATGVLLHTNLGRAPFSWQSQTEQTGQTDETGQTEQTEQTQQQPGYTNLEFNLETGQRGSRQASVGQLFAKLTGAERVHIVNNGAGAVLLVLTALARGRGVAVSRGEQVEIGGGFRVPEVMAQSGARLVEVGTTNRTRLSDFTAAVERPSADVAMCLKVHQSNYTIAGFTEQVSLRELAALGLPVVFDQGSGLLDAGCPWLDGGPPGWLAGEPAVAQSLSEGADVVVFSGDKLLGGPQAGIICGSAELVERCAAHPLARALRPGGHVLAGLQQVALAYLSRDISQLPFWKLATESTDRLARRVDALGLGSDLGPVEMASVPGGGTLPGVEIPSAGIRLPGDRSQALREHRPPVIARVSQDQTFLDFRTVMEHQDAQVAAAVRQAVG